MPESSASTRGFAGSDFKAATPASVGSRNALSEAVLRKRSHWAVPKKNSLFLTAGPPKENPKVLFTSTGFLSMLPAGALSLALMAFRAELRNRSQAAPWKSLVPPRVTTLVTDPPPLPNSAL